MAEPRTMTASALIPAYDGNIARIVTRRCVELFVRRLVLFIDDNEAEVFQRGKDSRPRTDDDLVFAAFAESPGIVPLAVRHAAVHDGNGVSEVQSESPDYLRRQGDFWDKNDGGFSSRSISRIASI